MTRGARPLANDEQNKTTKHRVLLTQRTRNRGRFAPIFRPPPGRGKKQEAENQNWGTGEAILTAIGAPPRMLRPPEEMLWPSEGLPGDTFPSFLTASAPPPEAAPVLGARPAFWPGQDPRSSQDQPGPPRPTAIKIIIGTGEATLTAIGAPPRARWLPLGSMQRAIPGLLISSRCLAPTRPPGPCTAV